MNVYQIGSSRPEQKFNPEFTKVNEEFNFCDNEEISFDNCLILAK
jgi:hypothetical protein